MPSRQRSTDGDALTVDDRLIVRLAAARDHLAAELQKREADVARLRALMQEACDDPYAQLTVSLSERMLAELARTPEPRQKEHSVALSDPSSDSWKQTALDYRAARDALDAALADSQAEIERLREENASLREIIQRDADARAAGEDALDEQRAQDRASAESNEFIRRHA